LVLKLTPAERASRFKQIEAAYQRWWSERDRGGEPACRVTPLGLWGHSSPSEVFELFERLHLDQASSLADLGSGDGLVTCIAQLFCPATGIECDPGLVAKAQELAGALGLDVRFILGDFLAQDLSAYDFLYAYPDKPLMELEKELARRLRGRLIVYSCHFPLKHLDLLESHKLTTCWAAVYGPKDGA
jgi:hypothetical protein